MKTKENSFNHLQNKTYPIYIMSFKLTHKTLKKQINGSSTTIEKPNKKNALFVCVFMNENYLKLLYLWLESVILYGNLKENTDIIIYTSTDFANKIKRTELFSDKIIFQINDEYNNLDNVCKSRLDIFDFSIISNYEKILYTDIDVIIMNDINEMFNKCTKNVLYAKKESTIENDYDFYGKTFFQQDGDMFEMYKEDMSAFSSGILLFNNCDIIKNLFCEIKTHIINYPHSFYDQPHIVYITKKNKLIDNITLDKYIEFDITKNEFMDTYTMIHFSGGVGVFENKFEKMSVFLKRRREQSIYNIIQKTKHFIDTVLIPVIEEGDEKLEGNLFMLHEQLNYTDQFVPKQQNLVALTMRTNVKQVLEIGFNSGFSALLMLISNPKLHITCVDICSHSYTIPCYNAIKKHYGERIQFFKGNSALVLSKLNTKYDLIHIDGAHDIYIGTSDVVNSYRLSKNGSVIIMDDYDFEHLRTLWDNNMNIYQLKPLVSQLYNCNLHDIRFKFEEND
jgi:predicted O-methyltransferase YrrM